MTQTIDDTLAERGERYGEFEGHAELTQALKDDMQSHWGWHELDADMKECLDMVAHKIGRIINGDPQYIDSWTDICGYVRLVEKRLIAEQGAEQGEDKDKGEDEAEDDLVSAHRLFVWNKKTRKFNPVAGDGNA